jgi:hypothetical protein
MTNAMLARPGVADPGGSGWALKSAAACVCSELKKKRASVRPCNGFILFC